MPHWKPDWLGLRLGVLWTLHRIGAPSWLVHKVLLGRRIGSGFRCGRGSCVIGRSVAVGARVRIGRNVAIVAETVDIGDDVTIGDGVTIRCRHLVLRKRCRIDERTVIRGVMTPNSGFELGENGWIYSDCHINTDESVRIGDRSAAGSHTLIFTHSSYLPITHGYPVTIAPVVIEHDVWLPWHVFILPGARIGAGATIGAFSLVAGEVPANSLAVGVPARVVKDATNFRRRYDGAQLQSLVTRLVHDAVRCVTESFQPSTLFFPRKRTMRQDAAGQWLIMSERNTVEVVLWQERRAGYVPSARKPDAVLFVTIGEIDSLPSGANWIDPVSLRSSLSPGLDSVLRDVVESLSHHGIRFDWLIANEWHVASTRIG